MESDKRSHSVGSNTYGKPTYTKWSRKTGGRKVCTKCGHGHHPVTRKNGKAHRMKECVSCGARLPTETTYPKRCYLLWRVREFDPKTGRTIDHPVHSSEEADEFIRLRERDFTPHPI